MISKKEREKLMLMKMRSRMQNQKGFTLVELMVVVVILGILVAIAVPVYNSVTARAQEAACLANMRTMASACMQYSLTDPAPAAGDYSLTNTKFLAYFQEKPACPVDEATYTITPTVTDGNLSTVKIECSTHGVFTGNGS